MTEQGEGVETGAKNGKERDAGMATSGEELVARRKGGCLYWPVARPVMGTFPRVLVVVQAGGELEARI